MTDLFDPTLLDALLAAASSTPALTSPVTAVSPSTGGDDVLAASKALAAEVHVPNMVRAFLPHQAAAFVYVAG